MFRLIVLLMLMSVAGVTHADNAIYKQVCRMDDPFVYCTQGCKETKAWKPRKPYAGVGYTPQPGYCPWPMTGKCCIGYVCFKPWSMADYNDYYQNRVAICPRAHDDGAWVRERGQGNPEDEPITH